MSATAQLLEAVRKEARPGIWTQGVNLARTGAVALQSRSGSEIELRVRAPGRSVPLTVVQGPDVPTRYWQTMPMPRGLLITLIRL